jgi:protein gp37
MDEKHGKDSSLITKTGNFNLPVRKGRDGREKIPPGQLVYTCFTSDFFVEEADRWREEAWGMMKDRSDVTFLFITKRIHRIYECIPSDWGEGYPNVHICCTMENQDRADYRLPIFKEAPILHKSIICEPLLEGIDLSRFLGPWVEEVVVGGESGNEARICDFDWVLDLRRQCQEAKVAFTFKQTGARFVKDGRLYRIRRRFQHQQAKKAGIDYLPEGER